MPTKTTASSCTRCGCALGEGPKVQPTNVDGETYCPEHFVWWRMHQVSEQGAENAKGKPEPRFNASQAGAAQCTGCGWKTVCFGFQPGQRLARCGHCGQNRAILVRPPADGLTAFEKAAIRDAQEAAKKGVPVKATA